VTTQARSGPDKRQDEIAARIIAAGTTTAAELADQFGVSLVTVHRDLDALARRGMVRRFHGGVTAQPSSVFESNVTYRLSLATAQKRQIAAEAARLVEPGMSVLLDDSTTTLALVERLAEVRPLTVISNFLPIISAVARWPDVDLVALGGVYSSTHDSFLGAPCVEAANALRADLGFFSFAGVADDAVYHPEPAVVAVKRALMKVVKRRVLLADHSKIGRTALHRATTLDAFEQVITDGDADPASLEELRRQVPVLVAKP
jgi:DeoR/GlpR family transcriptional regulator of sugar metabolism